MERITTYGRHFIDEPFSLYLELILQNFLPMQGDGSSRRHLLEEEIISPQTLGLLQVLILHRTSPEAYDLLAVVPSS